MKARRWRWNRRWRNWPDNTPLLARSKPEKKVVKIANEGCTKLFHRERPNWSRAKCAASSSAPARFFYTAMVVAKFFPRTRPDTRTSPAAWS